MNSLRVPMSLLSPGWYFLVRSELFRQGLRCPFAFTYASFLEMTALKNRVAITCSDELRQVNVVDYYEKPPSTGRFSRDDRD